MTVSRPGYAAVFRENRRGDNGAKNEHRAQRFHFCHDLLRFDPGKTERLRPMHALFAVTVTMHLGSPDVTFS